MDESKIFPIIPTKTFIPLVTAVAVCSAVFAMAWWAASLQSQVQEQGRTMTDFRDETRSNFAALANKLDQKIISAKPVDDVDSIPYH